MIVVLKLADLCGLQIAVEMSGHSSKTEKFVVPEFSAVWAYNPPYEDDSQELEVALSEVSLVAILEG